MVIKKHEKKQHINLAETDYKAILYVAVLLRHKMIIKLLISSSLDINCLLGGDSTALNLVVYEGHDSVVQILLNEGANLIIKDSHRWTPYTAALISGRDLMPQILLEYSHEAVNFRKSTSFVPNRLIKPIATSEVIVSEDGYIVETGLSLS